MISIFHELGHALKGRALGYPLERFELELENNEPFGEVQVGGQPRDRHHDVLIAFMGPLAEFRQTAGGRRIDKARSISLLANNNEGDLPVFFEGEDAPTSFHAGIIGGDWNVVRQLMQDTVDDPNVQSFDPVQAWRAIMEESIVWINRKSIWEVIRSISADIIQLPEVRQMGRNSHIIITDQFNEILNRYI